MTSLSDANATGSASGSKSFTYDENGNLSSDGRKGLHFSWNVLNLVSGATAHDGSSLKYSWLSDGTKVASVQDDRDGNIIKRHYIGSFVFVEDPVSGEWVKESVGWDEGRIFFDVPFLADTTAVVDTLAADLGYRDCWYATDHLGNVRAVIDITPGMPAPQILEQSDYLPFGTKTVNPAHASMQANRWRYAGKEEQAFGSLNLGLLDFGARMYDPFTARWTAVDPMAGKYRQISPYSYCGGNPVGIFDPDGNSPRDYLKGLLLGIATNIIPGPSSRRDISGLDSQEDYNSGLKTADIASTVISGGMVVGGEAGAGAGAAMVAGGGAAVATVAAAPEGIAVAASGALVISGSELLKLGGTALALNTAKNVSSGYSHGNSDNPGDNNKTSIGSIKNKIKRGQSPKSITRADKGRTIHEQDHIHFSDGSALNRDGTWKHLTKTNKEHKLIKEERVFLEENGWKLPE